VKVGFINEHSFVSMIYTYHTKQHDLTFNEDEIRMALANIQDESQIIHCQIDYFCYLQNCVL
jgi:hypothetical protein